MSIQEALAGIFSIDDPDKLFSCEEYHYQNHKGLLLFPVMLLPWILAVAVMFLLGVGVTAA